MACHKATPNTKKNTYSLFRSPNLLGSLRHFSIYLRHPMYSTVGFRMAALKSSLSLGNALDTVVLRLALYLRNGTAVHTFIHLERRMDLAATTLTPTIQHKIQKMRL